MTFADKAYQGAGGTVRTPFKRHQHRPKLSIRQKTVNKSHARIRPRGEQAVATLKTWRILTKLRCSPSRAGALPNNRYRQRQQIIHDFVQYVVAGIDPDAPAMGVADSMRRLPAELPDDRRPK